MGTRQSREHQEEIWFAKAELARSPGHPFYQRLNSFSTAGSAFRAAHRAFGRCAAKPVSVLAGVLSAQQRFFQLLGFDAVYLRHILRSENDSGQQF